MEITDTIVLIPSLNPNERLLQLVWELREEGFEWILVVDDGSILEAADIFRKVKDAACLLVHHKENLGKGAAIKTALRTALEQCGYPNGCITVDADGQHLPKDVRHMAEAMKRHPDTLVLGTRDFHSENVPMRSLLGNRITSVLFRLTSGISCPDTQTGLRGIPANLLGLALSEEGSRYEYEMNFLMDAVRQAPVEYVPIETVYESRNGTSHFRPVADSCRVYGRFLRFLFSSLIGAVVEYGMFYILTWMLLFPQTQTIFAATAISRIGSSLMNYLLNRYWSFHSRMPAGREAFQYFFLVCCQMLVSAALVSLVALTHIPVIAAKVIVDTMLFFVSFRIQKYWVFRQEVKDSEK